MSGPLFWEVSGLTSLGCPNAVAGMRVWYGQHEVGVVDEAEKDFVRIHFTTDSRTIHRELAQGVDEQTLAPRVERGIVVLTVREEKTKK